MKAGDRFQIEFLRRLTSLAKARGGRRTASPLTRPRNDIFFPPVIEYAVNVKSTLKKLFPFLLSGALFFACAFYPEEAPSEARTRVVRVWHIETFEGGKGSRASLLKAAARRVEEARTGVYFLITVKAAEGAVRSLEEGDMPDAISFGVGLSQFAELSEPLPYSFAGGEADGRCLAVPWCAGRYYLFSRTEDFSAEGKTAISRGGENLPAVAARLAGINGEELPSLSAYSAFLAGEYRYLLGTQRDVCRFETRGVNVYKRELPAYCDLYQYFSVLSAEQREDCLALLGELLSERGQSALSQVGMLSVPAGRTATVHAFTSAEGLRAVEEEARAGGKNLEKYLKTVEFKGKL